MGSKIKDRCPVCGASPCAQRKKPTGVARCATDALVDINTALPADHLAVVMMNHPELPVLLMGDEDCSPGYYVDVLPGRAFVGEYIEYGDRIWDDRYELAELMLEDGCSLDEIGDVIDNARHCIWACWEHFQGVS